MVNTIIWTIGIYLFFFFLFFLLILLFFFLGFTYEGPKEKEEKMRAGAWDGASRAPGMVFFFFIIFFFFLFSLPMQVIILLHELPLANAREMVYSFFYILERDYPTSVSHLKDDVILSNTYIFFLALFLQVIHLIFSFSVSFLDTLLSCKLPTRKE